MLHVHYRTSVTIFEAAFHKEWGKKRRNHIIYWRYKKLNRESINQKLVVPKRKRSCCTLLTLGFQINLKVRNKNWIPIPDKKFYKIYKNYCLFQIKRLNCQITEIPHGYKPPFQRLLKTFLIAIFQKIKRNNNKENVNSSRILGHLCNSVFITISSQ